jgi:hypothetical protein
VPKSVTTGKKSKKRLKQNLHQTTLFIGIEHFAADYLSELSKIPTNYLSELSNYLIFAPDF